MLRYMRENTGNWIIKFFLGIIVLVFVFFGVGSMNNSRNNTVASVNDDPITFNEFQDAYRSSVARMRERFGDNLNDDLLKALNVKQQTLNSLIEDRLVTAEADKLEVLVSDKELQDSLMSIKAFQRDGAFDLELYKKVLGLNAMTPEMYEQLQRKALRQQKVRDMVLSSINVSDMEAENWYRYQNTKMAVDYIHVDPESFTDVVPTPEQIEKQYTENKTLYQSAPKRIAMFLKFSPQDYKDQVSVTDAQVKDYYDQNTAKFVTPEKVEARHILIRVEEDADQEAVDAAREKAWAVYERAGNGEDFAELAKETSEGPSAESGGYLGAFEQKSMVKPFADKAFAMKAGEISEPVRTMFGWHVIKVEARFDAVTETLEAAAQRIRTDLAQEEMQNIAYYQAGEAFDSVIDGDDFEQVALIAKKDVKTTPAFAQDGEGLDIEQATAFANAAFALKKDEISDVKQLGEEYYLIKVTELIAPEQLPLEAVKEEIVTALTQTLRKEAAKARAGKLVEKIKSPADMERLAKENNLTLATTELFGRNDTVRGIGRSAELTKAAFALTENTPLCPTVQETGQGFFIIAFDRKEEPAKAEMDENLDGVKRQLTYSKQGQYYQAWVNELRENSQIEIDPEFFN